MKTSKIGIELIKEFEGCDLKATKALSTEKYYTIGFGHYGSDVKKNQIISKEEAEELLIKDLPNYEKYVNMYYKGNNQTVFDVLVSFCYNCGAGSLKTLCKNRDIETISEKIVLYNKSGGVTIKGLVNRRKKEQKLLKEAITYKINTLASGLNLRNTPNGKIIMTIPKNEKVVLLDEKIEKKNRIEWVKIKYKGKIGYVAKKYLKKI